METSPPEQPKAAINAEESSLPIQKSKDVAKSNGSKDEADGEDSDDSDDSNDEGDEANKEDNNDEESKNGDANIPISLETMAPQLTVNAAVMTSTQAPNLDMEGVDISEFQAEIDHRLPLWQAEAAKEDGLQDPPSVKVYDGVVLATKVHYAGRQSLNQMICLQKAAFNHRRNYPWVIFHTVPVTAQQVVEARALAYPGTVTFVQDSPPLEEVVGNFSQYEQDYLINRCQCCHPKDPSNCCKHPDKKIDWGFWW